MKILAFGHKSRVGKDVATRFLVNYIKQKRPDLKVERRAFADKVKDISYQLYKHHGLQPGPYYDEYPEARNIKLPLLGMDAVEVWISVGNRLRDVYSKTWIDFVLLDCSADIVVISDLRFPQEIDGVLSFDGYLVRIDKKDAPIRDSISDNILNDFRGWHKILDNDSTIDSLNTKLINLILELKWF